MKKNNKKGFTLVELVIVVAVMAILVAVAIPTIGSISGSARTSVANTNAQTIESMIKLAEAEGSKTSSDAVSNALIAQVIVEARLGIEEGIFEYDPTSGNVEAVSATTETDGLIYIDFEAKEGSVTVTGGNGDPAEVELSTLYTEAAGE